LVIDLYLTALLYVPEEKTNYSIARTGPVSYGPVFGFS
jgi:hypothetical protein